MQRNQLATLARNLGIDPDTIPNDSKLEQKVLWVQGKSGAVTGTAAASTLTSDNTVVSDADTVTIGDKVYTFKTTLGTAANQVLIVAANADATLTNLVNAINGAGTSGTDYTAATQKNPSVSAAAVGSHATVVTSRDTNANGDLATTTTAAHLSWTGTTLKAGTPGVAGVIAGATTNTGGASGLSGGRNTSI